MLYFFDGGLYNVSVNEIFSAEREMDQIIWHQVRIDVPRTNPHLSLYQFEATQKVLDPGIHLILGVGKNIIRLGYTTSRIRLRAGHKRFSHTLLSSLSIRIHRYRLPH